MRHAVRKGPRNTEFSGIKEALIFVLPFTTIICRIAISGLVSEKSDRVNHPKSMAMPSHFLGPINFPLLLSE